MALKFDVTLLQVIARNTRLYFDTQRKHRVYRQKTLGGLVHSLQHKKINLIALKQLS